MAEIKPTFGTLKSGETIDVNDARVKAEQSAYSTELSPEAALGNLIMRDERGTTIDPNSIAPLPNQAQPQQIGMDTPVGIGTTNENDLIKGLQDTRGKVEGTFASIMDKINAAYDVRQKAISDRFSNLQREERMQGDQQVSGAQAQLGRLRGVGFSSAGIGVINGIQDKIKQRIDKLETMRNDALSQGDEARANSIANLQMKQLETLADMDSKLVNTSIALMQESRLKQSQDLAISEAQRTRSYEDITRFAQAGIPLESFSSGTISQLEKGAGLPSGTFSRLYTSVQESEKAQNEAQKQKAALDVQKTMVEIAKSVPSGQEFVIPGVGSVFGLKEKDMRAVEVNGRLFSFDPETGNFVDTKISIPKQKTPGGGGSTSGSTSVFGQKISDRTPLYDNKNTYIGDEVVLADGSKRFVDPSGSQEIDPTQLDLGGLRRGNPSSMSAVQMLFNQSQNPTQ